MSDRKAKYSNVNVDTTLLEKINDLIANPTQINAIHEFLSVEYNIKQLITIWSYYNTINDHPNFTNCTIKLIKLSQISIANDVLLKTAFSPLIKDILQNHIKIIYRGLSNMKPSITNPVLNLLTEFTKFKTGVEELLTNFDFNLSIIPKLLTPSKNNNYRFNFIQFWLSLLSNSQYLNRKDLLSNYKKLNNTLYKFLEDDSTKLVTSILSILDLKILMEPHYNKQLKSKIFNEFVLSKLVSVFIDTTDSTLKTQLYDFLIKLTTNDKHGLKFHDDKIWFRNTNGVNVQHSNFKIYNRLIFNMILNLKPYEDDLQLKLILEIFGKIPELVPAYTQYLFQIHGSNDAKLSSFWIGQTLLLQEIIKLPIPSQLNELLLLNHDDDESLSMDLIMENLLPQPLTKPCLIKNLQSDSLLIKQLTCHNLLFFFQKFKKVINFLSKSYDDDGHDLNFEISNNLLKTRLPDLNIIISVLNDIKAKHPDGNNQMLILTLTMIIKEYLLNFQSLTAIIPNDIYLNLILKDELNGVELIILDNYLELQENINDTNSIVSKWWNAPPNDDDKNSFFTNLLKLSLSNQNFANKVIKILQKLVDQTIIFQKESAIISQMFAILQSLKYPIGKDDFVKIWNFFDNIISRCVRSPYKYLDAARELTSTESDDTCLSPLIITIFEQWNFVTDKSEILNEWFCLLMRYLILSGESMEAIKSLFKTNNIPMHAFLDFTNYESKFVLNDKIDKSHFINLKDTSFFEFILITPLQSLEKSLEKRFPTSQTDIIGLIKRLELVINDDDLHLVDNNKLETVLLSMMEKLGNYLSSTLTSTEFKKSYWAPIFISSKQDSTNDKKLYISRVLNEIFKQLDYKPTEYIDLIMSLMGMQDLELESVTNECCWCLSNDQLINYTKSHSTAVRINVLKECLSRSLTVDSCDWETDNVTELQLINELVMRDLINVKDGDDDHLDTLIKANDENKYPLIKSICEKIQFNDFAKIKNDAKLSIIIGSVVDPDSHKEFLLELINTTIDDFYQHFTLDYLKLISNMINHLSTDLILEILEKIMSNDVVLTNAQNYFSIELMSILLNFPDYQLEKFINLLTPWILKSSLYINQTISQTVTISSIFKEFMCGLQKFFSKLNIWKFGSNILNTQLEIMLNSKFVLFDFDVLKYIHVIISKSNFKIEYTKSLQIFINNENNILSHHNYHHQLQNTSSSSASYSDLRFYSALIIHDLFYKNISTNSNQTLQFNLLQFYQGCKKADDLIIKKILIDIESKTTFNLVNHFNNWEFVETASIDDAFIKQEQNGLTISINKQILNRSIKNYVREDISLPKDGGDLISFYEHNKVIDNTTYDDEFMMMLIINNDELFITDDEDGDFKIDLKKLIDSNLLQFIICNLINDCDEISQISYKILSSIFTKLPDGKTKDLFKVYIGNLLSFESENYSSIVILSYANLLPVLNNPNHHIYDKATRYLLSSSRLKTMETPLFKYISQPSSNDLDSYYKQITWFLETLLHNIKDARDLKILNKDKVIEWVLNLNNNKYLNLNIRNLILSIVLKIIKVGGLNLLIKSYSLLSWLESLSLETAVASSNDAINKQFKLNYEKLSIAVKLIVDNDLDLSNKRKLDDWFDHDLNNHIKRVCN